MLSDQPEAVRERWVAEHFRALAQSIVDRGVLWYGTPEAVRELVTESGSERINDLTAQGRSVILLAPHFIGLDAAATRLTMEVPSAATMYAAERPAHRRAGRRRPRPLQVFLVSRKDGVRDLVRHLRAPRPVYYLPDMDFGRQGAVFVPFFGVQAATLLATAQLASGTPPCCRCWTSGIPRPASITPRCCRRWRTSPARTPWKKPPRA